MAFVSKNNLGNPSSSVENSDYIKSTQTVEKLPLQPNKNILYEVVGASDTGYHLYIERYGYTFKCVLNKKETGIYEGSISTNEEDFAFVKTNPFFAAHILKEMLRCIKVPLDKVIFNHLNHNYSKEDISDFKRYLLSLPPNFLYTTFGIDYIQKIKDAGPIYIMNSIVAIVGRKKGLTQEQLREGEKYLAHVKDIRSEESKDEGEKYRADLFEKVYMHAFRKEIKEGKAQVKRSGNYIEIIFANSERYEPVEFLEVDSNSFATSYFHPSVPNVKKTFEVRNKDEEKLGELDVVIIDTPLPVMYLHNISVEPKLGGLNLRGRGVGSKILKAFERVLVDQKRIGLLLNATRSMKGNHPRTFDMYERHDWKPLFPGDTFGYMYFFPEGLTKDQYDKILFILNMNSRFDWL